MFSARWPDEFKQTRRFTEQDRVWAGVKRELNADAEWDVDFILRDSEEAIPDRGVEAVRKFCRGVSLDDLLKGGNTTDQRQAAWLDDTPRALDIDGHPNERRLYKHALTASELYQELSKPVSITRIRVPIMTEQSSR